MRTKWLAFWLSRRISSPTARSINRRCSAWLTRDDCVWALAAQFVSWRKTCKSTIRNSYQILSRGTPNLENELWNVSAQVINGALKPEDAGKQLQAGLDKWYKPAK